MAIKRKSKGCLSETQTHSVFPSVRGIGCTREAAEEDVIRQLLERATKDRREKCESLTCDKDSRCVTFLLPFELKALLTTVTFSPFIKKDCPRKIAWLADLTVDIDNTPDYRSSCTCVPGRKFF